MNYTVQDPVIVPVISENGKHWQLTTYDEPVPERTCEGCKHEVTGFIYNYPCCECRRIHKDHYEVVSE